MVFQNVLQHALLPEGCQVADAPEPRLRRRTELTEEEKLEEEFPSMDLLAGEGAWRGPTCYLPSGAVQIDAYTRVTMSLVEQVCADRDTGEWLPDAALLRLLGDRGSVPTLAKLFEWYRAGDATPELQLLEHYKEYWDRVTPLLQDVDATKAAAACAAPWNDEKSVGRYKIVRLVPHADFPNDATKIEAEMLLFAPTRKTKDVVQGLLDQLNDRGLRLFVDSAGGGFTHADCEDGSVQLRDRAALALNSRPGPFLLNLMAIDRLPGADEDLP